MKKLWKSAVVAVLALAVTGAGVFAAVNKTMNVTNTVSFTASDVYVDISGSAKRGSAALGTDYSYTAPVDNPNPGNPTAWAIPAVVFDTSNYAVTYEFTFTNKGSKGAVVAFTKPQVADPLSLTGGLRAGTQADYTYSGDSVTLAEGESAVFKYTLTLTKFNRSVASTATNFSVSISAQA